MSYIYRCGCVGEDSPICPKHRVNHIIQSSASPSTLTEKQIYKDRKVKLVLSNKKAKFGKKFNLVFLPSAKQRPLEKISAKGDPIHNHVSQFFAKKHQAVIYCEYEELAANLCSIYSMGYEDHQIRVMNSLRTYDIKDVRGHHEEFRGSVIMFGNYDLDALPKSFVFLGQLCLYESHFIKRDWIKNVLDYDSHTFRPYLGFKPIYDEEKLKKIEINKSLVIKTPYTEIFNLIKNGSIHTDALRCITHGEKSSRD